MNRWHREHDDLFRCCEGMFGLFKKDPVEKLRKEHADLLARAHKMSTVDRAKSDALVAQAAEIEEKLVALQSEKS